MSRGQNTIKRSEVSTIPFMTKYSSSLASSSLTDRGITIVRGINTDYDTDGLTFLNYAMIKQMFYQEYITGSLLNSASYWNPNIQATAASGTFDDDYRYFPISSSAKITVVAIPRTVFGEQIARKSVRFKSQTVDLIDDGNGNIVDAMNSYLHVGNVLYNQGIAVITHEDYQYALYKPDCALSGTALRYTPDNPFFGDGCITGSIYDMTPGVTDLYTRAYLATLTPAVPNFRAENFAVPNTPFAQGFPGYPNLTEWFQMKFDGYMNIPDTGTYNFKCCSDDGAIFRLYDLNDNLVYQLNNNLQHAYLCQNSNIALTAGTYRFEMDYYQGPPIYLGLTLYWTRPGGTEEIIPKEYFICYTPEESIVDRTDVLYRFDLQGEGGYPWNSFNFVDNDKMYVSQNFANFYYPGVIGGGPSNPNTYYNQYKYTPTINGTTYYGLQNILRFCYGNSNSAAIFRDGRVFWSGNTKIHPWVQSNISNFKDIFMPSSYRANYVQLVLMNNGELRKLDLDNAAEENDPPIVIGTDYTVSPAVTKTLNDVTKIIKINQAHNADIIVACADDSVWHVVIANGNYIPSGEVDARRIGNLNASEIQFAMIGDPGDSCYVVLKDNLKQIYKLNNTGRHLEQFAWLTERSLTPVELNPFVYYDANSTVLLEPDECFIDGCSNEFHYTFLTNKYVHCFKARQYGPSQYAGQAPLYVKHTLTSEQKPALRMCTATSYAMSVELADGFYLLSSNGISNYNNGSSTGEYYKAYQYMQKFTDWTSLTEYLAPLRGLTPFDTTNAISCTQG